MSKIILLLTIVTLIFNGTGCSMNSLLSNSGEYNNNAQNDHSEKSSQKNYRHKNKNQNQNKKKQKYCICLMIYNPVCGKNKKTYSNACQAMCEDVHYEEGECLN